MKTIVVPDQIKTRIASGAIFFLSDSGGKDSQAMRIVLRDIVPASQTVVIHAPLREVEWPEALEHAREGALRFGLEFLEAHAVKTFLEMVEHRYKVRPGPNSPCWPSKANRQCTSDLKRGPIEREVRRYLARRELFQAVSCMGLRAQESTDRAKRPALSKNVRQSIAGRDWWEWNPILDFSIEDVFATIEEAGEKPHYAYALGNDRLSCMFCIFGSPKDLRNGAIHNPELYRRYVEIEERTGYTMHMSRKSLVQLTGIPVDREAS